MFQVLYALVLLTISTVNCQDNCPLYEDFSNYPNNVPVLQSLFNGNYLLAYTTSDEGALNCHRMKYVIDANNVLTGYSEFPNCCLKLDKFAFSSDQINYTIGGLDNQSWCPWIKNETKGSMKVLATTGTGTSVCLILAVCEPEYYGLMVMCRGDVPAAATIVATILKAVGDLGFSDILAMKSLSLASCAMESNYCSNF